jgi:negative regulator of sigma-B (phosphoserine phosphatase)
MGSGLGQLTRVTSASYEISGFSRPMPGETDCGDALVVYPDGGRVTVLVVDGLGHGTKAHEASSAAVAYVTERLAEEPRTGLEELLRGCHKAIAGTRGAAVGICRLDPEDKRLSFCGVGNISLVSLPTRRGLGVSLAGVVGYRMRRIKEFVSPLSPGDMIALFSDGISTRFSLKTFRGKPLDPEVEAAGALLAQKSDDATLVVVRMKFQRQTSVAQDRSTS